MQIFQVFALVYVAAVVPLRAGFQFDPLPPSRGNGMGDGMWWLDLLVDVYFVTDVVVQFHTAYVDQVTGVLITSRRAISERYMTSWFIIDVMSVLPFQYIEVLAASGSSTDNGRRVLHAGFSEDSHYMPKLSTINLNLHAGDGGPPQSKFLKMFRFLRIAKLLRLTKIQGMMVRYEAQFDVNKYLSITITLVIIGTVAHFVSCVWYFIGCTDAGDTTGWVTNEGTHLGWEENSVKSLVSRYSASMWSVFAGRWAFTEQEMLFSVFAELVIGLIYGALAGVMSSLMMSSKIVEQEKALKFASIRAWMKARHLTRPMQAAIMSYYNSTFTTRAVFDEPQVRIF